MKLRRPKPKTLFYAFLVLGSVAGIQIYNSDSEPPKLISSSFSPKQISLGFSEQTVDFSVRISDARGVELAELRCMEENKTLLLSRIVMSGSFAGRVSFGAPGSSFNWVSNWEGNRYDFSVLASGQLPPESKPLSCSWFAYLEDELGNSQLVPTGYDLVIK